MKTLYFIRHGFALHNQYFKSMGTQAFYDKRCIDSPLIGEGWKQASELNRIIHTFPIEIALVSPMLRTLQTATEVFQRIIYPFDMCGRFTRVSDGKSNMQSKNRDRC